MKPKRKEWPVEMTDEQFVEKLNNSLQTSKFTPADEAFKNRKEAKRLGISIEEYLKLKEQK